MFAKSWCLAPPCSTFVFLLSVTRKYIPVHSATRAKGSAMGKSKQTGNHNSDKKKSISKTWKTKRRTKDLDQIHADMKPETAAKLLHQKVDVDVTGCAQHYCLHCARYFVDLRSMKEHFKTKVHKRQLKKLREEPYTQAEAERAAGMGSYIQPKKVEVKTQDVEEDMA
ncbi:zinc finger protein 593 [Pungitius pungitius]|uniref:zinc finger protein 593 n=1 Tax=Pungitius pungitius TaxID=134920 RepID=UPI00188923EF|nr:zinc finger protein 593 [Pungitius pungitius]